MSLSFILVEPTRAVNVGAAARALKTMGFSRLIVVNSSVHRQEEAYWVAHGAQDILDEIVTYGSLADLRADFDLLVATTARERGAKRQYFSPLELQTLLTHQNCNQLGLVFGRESSGLTNSELALCDLLSYIPLKQTYPSLNLAQAVMVYSYSLTQVSKQIGLTYKPAVDGELQMLKAKANSLLAVLNVKPQDKMTSWLMESLSKMSSRDCKLAHQLINDLNKKLSG